MAPEKTSAEKDLLRLIENPQEVEAKKTSVAPAVSVGGVKGRVRVAGPALRFKMPDLKAFLADSRSMLRVLFGVTVCVFVYFVVNIFHEYTFLEKARNIKNFENVKAGADTRGKKNVSPEISGEESGPDDFSLRNVFKPFAKKKPEEEKKVDDLASRVADLKLVGISIEPSADDSYAMVENTKTSVTFFLKRGEIFSGMEVMAITDDKLTFKVEGQTVDLR